MANSNHWAKTVHPITAAAREASIEGIEDRSHEKIISLLWEYYQPKSVVDFGCGLCKFLHKAKEYGAEKIHGYDIPEVPLQRRGISEEQFTAADLSKPIDDIDSFDLAISVEVAEHIPEQYSENFIANIVKSAPVVLFGAAIPYQGGMGHVNENWLEYWSQLFAKHDYYPIDLIRKNLWTDSSVTYFYRMNTVLYVHKGMLEGFESKGLYSEKHLHTYVHPDMYIKAVHRSLPPHMRRIYPDVQYYYQMVRGEFPDGDFEEWSSMPLNYSDIK